MNDFDGTPRRMPLVIGTLAVVILAIAVALITVNRANNASQLAVVVTPTPSPTVPPTPPPSPPAVDPVPPADAGDATPCATATFAQHLQPLNPPSDIHTYPAEPAMTIDTTKLYRVIMLTPRGTIFLCLQPSLAPHTVNNFVTLTRNHFYDGLVFHRVGPSSSAPPVAQGGDPQGTGNGGPGYKFNDEPVTGPSYANGTYATGAVAMANSGPNSNGSQFFIDTAPVTLPASYNLFADVEGSISVAKAIQQGDPMTLVLVEQQQ